MKTVEALLSMPIIAAFIAGANVVAGTDTTPVVAESSASGLSAVSPLLGLGVIAVLLASGLYFIGREMRLEVLDQKSRRRY